MSDAQEDSPFDPPELRLSTLGHQAASFATLAPEALASGEDGLEDVQLYTGGTIPLPGADDSLALYNGTTIPVP